MIKYGENGKGIRSVWYPKTIAQRIANIAKYKNKILFIEGDGLRITNNYLNDSLASFFFDPPYTVGGKRAGKRLYRFHELDHERLFDLSSKIKGHFLMSYDISKEINDLALKYGFQAKEVFMKNTHHHEQAELIISRNLDWLD